MARFLFPSRGNRRMLLPVRAAPLPLKRTVHSPFRERHPPQTPDHPEMQPEARGAVSLPAFSPSGSGLPFPSSAPPACPCQELSLYSGCIPRHKAPPLPCRLWIQGRKYARPSQGLSIFPKAPVGKEDRRLLSVRQE